VDDIGTGATLGVRSLGLVNTAEGAAARLEAVFELGELKPLKAANI